MSVVSTIPGWVRLAFLAGGVSGGLAVAVLFVRPAPVGQPASTPGPAPMQAPAAISRQAVMPEPARPSFDIVTVSPEGNAVIAGRAAPNAEVTVRNGDVEIGRAQADSRGNWVLLPQDKLLPGPQRLTLSERRPDGTQMAGGDPVQLSVPARPVAVARATEPPPGRDDANMGKGTGRVTVHPGESLWRLARTAYGSGPRYTVIYQANQDQIREPRLIYPGQALDIPTASPAPGASVTPASSSKSR